MDPFGKSGPDEPDEFDPDSLGPDVPEAPDVEPDLEESFEGLEDVDDDLVEAFWGAVVFLNVAIAALSIGAMILYFRGDVTTGGGGIVVGLVAAIFAGRYYFGYTRGKQDGGATGEDADGETSENAPGGTDSESTEEAEP